MFQKRNRKGGDKSVNPREPIRGGAMKHSNRSHSVKHHVRDDSLGGSLGSSTLHTDMDKEFELEMTWLSSMDENSEEREITCAALNPSQA